MHSTNSTDAVNLFVPVSGSKTNRRGRLHLYHDLISVQGIVNIVIILYYSKSQGQCRCQEILGYPQNKYCRNVREDEMERRHWV